jgi:hypothetical protein
MPIYIDPELGKAWRELYVLQNDRAIGVLGGALLDDALTNALTSDWRSDTDKRTETARANLIREGGGALTFGLRIDLAYLLSIIGPEVHSDLSIIKEIRNRFAHRLVLRSARQASDIVTFGSPEIADRCGNLSVINSVPYPAEGEALAEIEQKFPVDSAKGRFVQSIILLSALFELHAENNEGERSLVQPFLHR